MVIGATARDILSLDLLGSTPDRATADVDIAVAVPSWTTFASLTSGLDRVGRREHTFHVAGFPVDVVPFGGIETPARTIDWRGGGRMSTFGLRETYAASLTAVLPGAVAVQVPTVAGLTALKLLAWFERRLETRRDAVDLDTLIGWYGTGTLLDDLYDSDVDLLEAYDFDPDLASAHRLGRAMADELTTGTPRLLQVLDDDGLARLAADMPTTVADRAAALRAVRSGLREYG